MKSHLHWTNQWKVIQKTNVVNQKEHPVYRVELKVKLFRQFLMLYEMAYSDFPKNVWAWLWSNGHLKGNMTFFDPIFNRMSLWNQWMKQVQANDKKFLKSILLFVGQISLKLAKLLKSYSKCKLSAFKRTADMNMRKTANQEFLEWRALTRPLNRARFSWCIWAQNLKSIL